MSIFLFLLLEIAPKIEFHVKVPVLGVDVLVLGDPGYRGKVVPLGARQDRAFPLCDRGDGQVPGRWEYGVLDSLDGFVAPFNEFFAATKKIKIA